MNDHCMNCMYSEYSEINIFINDITETDRATCIHQNSPYYGKGVDDETSCRLYLDANKYFLKKDRKEKIKKINESN